jgi:hypothetical protein
LHKNEQNSPDLQGILTFDSSNNTVSTGNALADMYLGNIANYKQWSVQAKYYNRYRIFEPYFQDDWRVSKRLTLNLGLRLSLFGTYRERYRNAFNFEPSAFNTADIPTLDTSGGATDGSLTPGSGNPLNGIVQCGGSGGTVTPLPGYPSTIGPSSEDGCLKGHLFNPAPRLGFAWDPKGDGKMAIRGGYGVFFEHTNGNEGNTESLEGSPPLVLTASQFNVRGYAMGRRRFPLSVTPSRTRPFALRAAVHLIQKELPGNSSPPFPTWSAGHHLTLRRTQSSTRTGGR